MSHDFSGDSHHVHLNAYDQIFKRLEARKPLLVTGAKLSGKSEAASEILAISSAYDVLDIPRLRVGDDLSAIVSEVESRRSAGTEKPPLLVLLSHQHLDYFTQKNPELFIGFDEPIDLKIGRDDAKKLLERYSLPGEIEKRILKLSVSKHTERGYTTYIPPILTSMAEIARRDTSRQNDKWPNTQSGDNDSRIADVRLQVIEEHANSFGALMDLEFAGIVVSRGLGQALNTAGTSALGTIGGFLATGIPIIGGAVALGLWAWERHREISPISYILKARSHWLRLDYAERQLLCYRLERHNSNKKGRIEPGSAFAFLSALFEQQQVEAISESLTEKLTGSDQIVLAGVRSALIPVEERFATELADIRGELERLERVVRQTDSKLQELSTEVTKLSVRIDEISAPPVEVSPLTLHDVPQFRPYTHRQPIMSIAIRELVENANRLVREGRRVLIVGEAGVGKTTVLYSVCRSLLLADRKIFNAGVDGLLPGDVSFYDDIDTRMAQRIFDRSSTAVIATARRENVNLIETRGWSHLQVSRKDYPRETLRVVLVDALTAEGAVFTEEGVEEALDRSSGLPGYLVELARSFGSSGQVLTMDSARLTPQGVIDLIEERICSIEDSRVLRLLFMVAIAHDRRLHRIHIEELLSGEVEESRIALPAEFLELSIIESGSVFALGHDLWSDVLFRPWSSLGRSSRLEPEILRRLRADASVSRQLQAAFRGSIPALLEQMGVEAAAATKVTLENAPYLLQEIHRAILATGMSQAHLEGVLELLASINPAAIKEHYRTVLSGFHVGDLFGKVWLLTLWAETLGFQSKESVLILKVSGESAVDADKDASQSAEWRESEDNGRFDIEHRGPGDAWASSEVSTSIGDQVLRSHVESPLEVNDVFPLGPVLGLLPTFPLTPQFMAPAYQELLLEEAVKLIEEHPEEPMGDWQLVAKTFSDLGAVKLILGKTEESIAAFHRAVNEWRIECCNAEALFRGSVVKLHDRLVDLGVVLLASDKVDQAIDCLRTAVRTARLLGECHLLSEGADVIDSEMETDVPLDHLSVSDGTNTRVIYGEALQSLREYCSTFEEMESLPPFTNGAVALSEPLPDLNQLDINEIKALSTSLWNLGAALRRAQSDESHETNRVAWECKNRLAGFYQRTQNSSELADVLVEMATFLDPRSATNLLSEALEIYRQLAREEDQFTGKVASTLEMIGRRSIEGELGPESAAGFWTEAEGIFRGLMVSHPRFILDHARVAAGLGRLYFENEDLPRAIDFWRTAEVSLSLSPNAGTDEVIARAQIMGGLGEADSALGRWNDAIAYFREAELQWSQLAPTEPFELERYGEAMVGLGRAYALGKREPAMAVEPLQKSVQLLSTIAVPGERVIHAIAAALDTLASVQIDLGARQEALASYRQAEETLSRLDATSMHAVTNRGSNLVNIARWYQTDGSPTMALETLDRALDLCLGFVGSPHNRSAGISILLAHIGDTYRQLAEAEKALRCYASSLMELEPLVSRNHRLLGPWAEIVISWGELAIELRDASRRAQFYRERITLLRSLDEPDELVEANLGSILAGLGGCLLSEGGAEAIHEAIAVLAEAQRVLTKVSAISDALRPVLISPLEQARRDFALAEALDRPISLEPGDDDADGKGGR